MRFINFFFLGSFAALVLIGLFLVRRPQCIDSRVVERIDRISPEGTERIWKCRLDQSVPYSPWMNHHLPQLEAEILKAERGLHALEKFRHPVRIVVITHRPWVYRLHGGTLFIGEELLKSEGHLSRGIIKSWIRERSEVFGEGELREEVYADFLQAGILGGFRIEDSVRGLKTDLGAQWPHVLKEAKTYCASPWKLSEHYELCLKDAALFQDQMWLWNLRPLLSTAMIAAWNGQGVIERYQALREMPSFLRGKEDAEDEFDQTPKGLVGVIETLKSFLLDTKQRGKIGGQSLEAVASAFEASLESIPKEGLRFDLLVSASGELKGNEPWLDQLTLFALKDPKLKVGVREDKFLWLLPTRQKLAVTKEDPIFSQKLVFFHCGEVPFSRILAWEGRAEKLLLTEACGDKVPPVSTWASMGAEEFARKGKDIRFVQIHLPSLLLRKDFLNPSADVYSILSEDPLRKLFGWEDGRFLEETGAYRPKASLDAIEWIRAGESL